MRTLPDSILLPHPQQYRFGEGAFRIRQPGYIALNLPSAAELLSAARQFQAMLQACTGCTWPIAAGGLGSALTIELQSHEKGPQAYTLDIKVNGINITAHDMAGAFYGLQTLTQLVRHYGGELPALTITDWPDMPNRGVMVDISRDKVPTMATLYRVVDQLAHWKINEFQLYTEHTFAYQQHPSVWAKSSPITAEEIMDLDAYCHERFVRLVPNQNSFGHMSRWLEHDKYRPLAEAPEGYYTRDGRHINAPGSLCPTDPGSIALVESLLDELLPNFSVNTVNVNCDETFDLGKGRSKALCQEKGKGRVYLDFLLEIYQRVQSHGFSMQYWGDIIGHYPELIPELPQDAVALEWGYEGNHPFDEKCSNFSEHNIPFYVCPGTSSWSSLGGRTDNMRENIRNAMENGLQHGAIGVLNTTWGDGGHWQTLPIDFPGFAYGAGMSWACAKNVEMNLPETLNIHAFQDTAKAVGEIICELGNIYQKPGAIVPNGNILFWAYTMPPDLFSRESVHGDLKNWLSENLSVDSLQQTMNEIDALSNRLDDTRMMCGDAALIKRELTLTTEMLRYGAQRLLALFDNSAATSVEATMLDARYREVWLARNRPGGLWESIERLRGQRGLLDGFQSLDVLTFFSRRKTA
ncbi:MAG: glycoside hydrolase family 20 zincin-like fold domain-containing protein [Pseudomonadota bacterium]